MEGDADVERRAGCVRVERFYANLGVFVTVCVCVCVCVFVCVCVVC
jgi:hypothetical protein